ncbi:MAG: dUTP diphosphatase [Candidatus Electryonea clarkiae]|nr:dUTP diphosphatase [Candidatus Electryonea clarkiae]MDP8286614.1 dUTP diphosphatase [Candidatus Electryonea clarkiae]
MKVSILNLDLDNTDLVLPRAMSPGAAGMDVFAAVNQETVLHTGDTLAVPTGFAVAVPEGYELQVRPRSGLALKNGIIIPNSPGTIDSDYRGEVKIILSNISKKPFPIKRGDRIAQLVLCPVMTVEWDLCEELPETERGSGGFGHTGV